MTRELLQEANGLNRAIIEIEEQIRRAEVIRQLNEPMHISDASGNHIEIDSTILAADIMDNVLTRLNQVKEDMYNRLLQL